MDTHDIEIRVAVACAECAEDLNIVDVAEYRGTTVIHVDRCPECFGEQEEGGRDAQD